MVGLPERVAKMIDEIIEREGGYSDHPSDRGGETMWGVTKAVARAHGYSGDMRALPRSLAVKIYARTYFEKPNFHLIAEHAPRLAEEMTDTGVNMGPFHPAIHLQRLLNALNRREKDYADIGADGVIGLRTVGALRAFLGKRGREGEDVLLVGMNCLQGERYVTLSEGRSRNEDFLYGWLRRVMEDVQPRRD